MRLKTLENRSFLTLVVLTTGAFLWIVRGFLMPVFWAVVVAVLFRPVYRRWLRLVGGRASGAALLTTLTVIVVVLIPSAVLVGAVGGQAFNLYKGITMGTVDLHAPIAYIARSIPALTDLLAEYGIDTALVQSSADGAVSTATGYIATKALAMGQGMLGFTLLFGLMLYFLFYFVRDWERILDAIVRALPLGDARERRLFRKFAEVARATMKGTLVVALVQGAIGGVLFGLLGVEAAVFWGVVMVAFSLLPVFGTAIVWGPAAIMLLATGSVWKGILLIAGGTFIIGMADNVLRPILVGHETEMPDYLVLLSTLGGLAVFGLSGVVIGPFVAALFLVVWQMLAEEYFESPESRASVTAAPLPMSGRTPAGRPRIESR